MPQKKEKDLWVEMSIREIYTQAHFAGIAYSHLNLKAVTGTDLVFSSIHSFLSHCAMISKMLKATDNENPPHSIGSVLGISQDSLIHSRVFRNHLEHYDERLQNWIQRFGASPNIGTYNIGSKSALSIPNFVFVSHYDPNTQIFTFVNDDFNLGAMSVVAAQIKDTADDWVQKMQQGTIQPPFI